MTASLITPKNNIELYLGVLFGILMPVLVLLGLAAEKILFTGIGAVATLASIAWVVFMLRQLKR